MSAPEGEALMDTNKMRAEIEKQFEEFFAEYEKKREANGWMALEAHVLVHMRNAWMASREAVVVELPDAIVGASRYQHAEAAFSHKEGIDECRAAIEAQGLRVKP